MWAVAKPGAGCASLVALPARAILEEVYEPFDRLAGQLLPSERLVDHLLGHPERPPDRPLVHQQDVSGELVALRLRQPCGREGARLVVGISI